MHVPEEHQMQYQLMRSAVFRAIIDAYIALLLVSIGLYALARFVLWTLEV